MRRLRSYLLILVLLAVALALLGGVLFTVEVRDGLNIPELLYLQIWLGSREEQLSRPAGQDDTLITFIVNSGDNAAAIGQSLQAQGLILDADLFRNYARYHGLDSQLEAGTYFLTSTQTIPEIALALTDSSAASITVQILEGWRREEIAAVIDANPLLRFTGAEFLAATDPGANTPPGFAATVGLPEGASLEGFLYPDTYFVPPQADAAAFRDILLEAFQDQVGPEYQAVAEAAGLTLYEVVTLASIVEREAVHAEEQPLIAGVYLNRLNIGMNLDADPTVQYGIGYRDGTWWPNITIAEYRSTQSPYNTYLYGGLPPGPIANPSRTAIEAVLAPTESLYYYFRAECSGSGYHVFASTFDEHVANGNCP